ncbi:RING finger and transmembrane domain-containing protein 1 [Striga asiatica]|uniref:RING finger and transmembrane domain-containing protein 1 n=1 Tax=Striga asiatica TaxID=4170 RepID=A0A5A7PZX4_STRAF|nr:RING finger and transmembrane domain-containing protein 1 [Striga asiatica]
MTSGWYKVNLFRRSRHLTFNNLFDGLIGKISMCGVIRNPRKDRLRLPPRSHEDLYARPARLLLGPGMAPGEVAAMPQHELNGPSTENDSDGLNRLNETGPLLWRKKPCPFPSLLGKLLLNYEKDREAHGAKAPRGQFLCLVCPPFFECPARFTGLLAYQALARCPLARQAKERSLSLLCSLY